MIDPQIIVTLKRDIERKQGEIYSLRAKLSRLEQGTSILYNDHVIHNHMLDRMSADEAQEYLDHVKQRAAADIGIHMYRMGVIQFDTLDGPYGDMDKTTIIRARAEVVK